MVAGEAVGGRAFPEGTALVVAPGGGDGFRVATSQERILDLVEAGSPEEASSEPRFMTL
jgi:hypothetical protein